MLHHTNGLALWSKEVGREDIEHDKSPSLHSKVLPVELIQQNPTKKKNHKEE